MPVQLIPDPDFNDPAKWFMYGNFGEVFFDNGSFRVGPGRGQNDAMFTNPTGQFFEQGAEYKYELVVPVFNEVAPGSEHFVIDVAGVRLFSAYDPQNAIIGKGAGTFKGEFVAPVGGDLYIGFNFNGEITLDRISVERVTEDMIKHSDLRKGIRAILLAVPGIPTAIAWENHEFKPVVGTPWIREILLPGTERVVASETIRGVGIMQYDIFWPANTKTESVEDLVDNIKEAFKPDTTVGTHSVVYRAERMPAIVDEKWYRIPIRLTWHVHSLG